MSWLSKILNYVPADEMKGISISGNSFWEVSSPKAAPQFFRALLDLMPEGSILYLEGQPVSEVRNFLQQRNPDRTTKVAMGTIWPRPEYYHIEITADNIEALAQLTEKLAIPEVLFHLHIYKNGEVLLEWHDAFDNPMLISKMIPEEKIQNFCVKLGVQHKRCDPK